MLVHSTEVLSSFCRGMKGKINISNTNNQFTYDHPRRPRGCKWGRENVYTGEKKIRAKKSQEGEEVARIFSRPYRLFPAPTSCPWVSEEVHVYAVGSSVEYPSVKIIPGKM